MGALRSQSMSALQSLRSASTPASLRSDLEKSASEAAAAEVEAAAAREHASSTAAEVRRAIRARNRQLPECKPPEGASTANSVLELMAAKRGTSSNAELMLAGGIDPMTGRWQALAGPAVKRVSVGSDVKRRRARLSLASLVADKQEGLYKIFGLARCGAKARSLWGRASDAMHVRARMHCVPWCAFSTHRARL